MSFFNELEILFTGMTLPVVLALVLGYIFLVVELYKTGVKIFGVVGCVLVLLGAFLRICSGDGNPFAQIFTLLFIEAVAVFVAFMILIMTVKKGWLYHEPGVEREDKQIEEEHGRILQQGGIGVALTDIMPSGKANIGGIVADVVTDGFYIKRGEGIRVVKHENGVIGVERAE